jgi:hypothetical protein
MNSYRFLVVLLLLGFCGNALAATVRLVPEADAVVPGLIEVDLVLEAADIAEGCTPRCSSFAGNVRIEFDPARLQYVGINFVAPAERETFEASEPQFIASSGGSDPVEFWFINALEQGTVATLLFDVIAAPGETVSISVEDNRPLLGSFEYAEPTNQFFFPDFVGAEVQVVPLPAAAWLFLSALAAVAARSRRAG